MPGHAVFIFHRTLPGKREAVREIWEKHMAPAISGNPDHLAYYYGFDVADNDVLRVFQLYRDQAASAAFLAHPSYAAYLAEVEGLLAGPPEIFNATPMWQKHGAEQA